MKKKIGIYLIVVLGVFLIFLLCLSSRVQFENRYAHILYAEDKIISAQVSDDQQWRIKCEGSLPEKLATTLKLFEDQYFDYHFGVNPISIFSALVSNIKAGRTVRGGSTITMQLARIHEGNQARTYLQKTKEIFLSLALELKYSKQEILQLYAQHAPYGGNTVGYCAAAARYYDKAADQLSWNEAATLAVLPNAPSKIYPGKAQQELIRKRNFLLHELMDQSLIDSITYRLSTLEDLPTQSHYFEAMAPHLLQEAKKKEADIFNHHTTIDYSLQQNARRIMQQYRDQYAATGIDNLCSIILRNDGTIAAYHANVSCETNCSTDVDILHSERSPGSTLKPFLYGVAIDAGMISPNALLEDIPVFYNGYSPGNFDKRYRGIVTAERALTESLNIPAVNLLQQYGTSSFLGDLRKMHFSTMTKSAEHYGLSLILGGGEVKPIELATAYMNMTRVANGLDPLIATYSVSSSKEKQSYFPLSSGSAFLTLDMLKGVNRPSSEDGWQYFQNQQQISWKTGTSFGFRDAWSVGTTSDYTILVWVGNADGEGRPGLTGIKKAAPVLFDLFKLLPSSPVQAPNLRTLEVKHVCEASGYLPTEACKTTTAAYFPRDAHTMPLCSYHKIISLDESETRRVYQNCTDKIINKATFTLDPVVNNYYKKFTGISHALPPYKPDCNNSTEKLKIIYPAERSQILLPRDLNEKKQALIAKVATDKGIDSLFWFINHELVTVTCHAHETAINLDPGEHTLTVVGSNGIQRSHDFEIIE